MTIINRQQRQAHMGAFDKHAASSAIHEVSFLEIKQLNDTVADKKQTIMLLLAEYRASKKRFQENQSAAHRLYASYEMAFIRSHFLDAWNIYQLARKHSRILTESYIHNLNVSAYGHSSFQSPLAA